MELSCSGEYTLRIRSFQISGRARTGEVHSLKGVFVGKYDVGSGVGCTEVFDDRVLAVRVDAHIPTSILPFDLAVVGAGHVSIGDAFFEQSAHPRRIELR
jgi:hypothetical protein